MKKLFILICLASVFNSCDDGDIILTSLDFTDSNLESCTGTNNYVFFNINTAAIESISLELNTTEVLFEVSDTLDIIIDGSTNTLSYRQYNGNVDNTYFCNSIPPISPAISNDYVGDSGTAKLFIEAFFEDLDGVDEDFESNLDTDGDGLLNYYDGDDDGDNVPTATEIGPDPENPLDTDNDGIFDYLDEDDDGDNILTRNEDANGNLDPTDDESIPNAGPDYLNADVAIKNTINLYRSHSYTIDTNISLILFDIVLNNGQETITQETLNMGSQENVLNTLKTVTPPFNEN